MFFYPDINFLSDTPKFLSVWINTDLIFTTNIYNIYKLFFISTLCFFREFCGNELSDQKFARKVARLNSNVLHLCFTQNTDIEVLHPMHTLQNLMHLLNTEISDLGR